MSVVLQLTLAIVVGCVRRRGVRHEVVHTAVAIAPDVAQVQPVAHLVRAVRPKLNGAVAVPMVPVY